MKIKKKHLYLGAAILVLLVVAIYYFTTNYGKNDIAKETGAANEEQWNVDQSGYLSYPLSRGEPGFKRETINQTNDLLISRIVYPSKDWNIYGLLVLPVSASELLPGAVILPGAGVSKESELELAMKIAELGAAVLVIDQRGTGETDGPFQTLDEDYANFLNGKEPYQHLMVYDALRAYDLLRHAPFVDSEKIIFVGESLGGRIAVIAAAIDRNINGVLVISSAGFGLREGNDASKDRFLKSIDSDHYINLISPRKIVMMHNSNDNNIPVSSAVASYFKAQQPKRFVLVNDTMCNHGYCDSMHNGLLESLDFLIGLKQTDVAIKETNLNVSV